MPELNNATLPLSGSHLIEASAGTGKTHNIIRIYLRLLIEKEYRVDQILVMTFTNAATAELRNRLSSFLRATLRDWQTSTDPLVENLRQIVDQDKAHLLINTAILQLDEATIFTIHSFCKRALSQQAFFSGMSFNAHLDGDSNLIQQQAVDDWYRNMGARAEFECIYNTWPTPEQFANHWRQLIHSNDELIKPEAIDVSLLFESFCAHWPEEQAEFIKQNIESKRLKDENKRAQNRLDFDCFMSAAENLDIKYVERLSEDTIARCFKGATKEKGLPTSNALLKAVLHNARVKKIILALEGIEFIKAKVTLEKSRLDQLDFNDLIIQLKNALYGDNKETLRAVLLEQFPAVLVDEFQDTDPDQYSILEAIYHQQPNAFVCMIGDPKQAIYSFRGGDVFAYMKAKTQTNEQWTMNTNYRSCPSVIDGYNKIFLADKSQSNSETFGFGIHYTRVEAPADATSVVYSDQEHRNAVQWVNFEPEQPSSRGLNKEFQQVIARWCSQEIVQLITHTHANDTPVKPGEIALLVRGYSEAELLQKVLSDAGINSVYLSARNDVFSTIEAGELYKLLSGIWLLENDRSFVAALASRWIGLNITELDALQQDEHLWSYWQSSFEQWRQDWKSRGLMSMLLDIMQAHFKPTSQSSDRELTNMLHLAEILQKESSRYRQPDALLHWFERVQNEDSAQAEEWTLRLESDEALVKIITMHGSKGLEYPIVFLPFVSYYGRPPGTPASYRYHDRKTFQARQSFLATDLIKQMTNEEQEAELVRLFYVSATRAKSRLYICCAPFSSFKSSPLGLTLKQQEYKIDTFPLTKSQQVLTVQEQDISIPYTQAIESTEILTPREFTGHIERDWWLSSFSSLTRHVGHSAKTAPDRDENEVMSVPIEKADLRFRLAKGAEAGNLLHDSLEHLDFSTPDYPECFSQAKDRYSSLVETFSQEEFDQWLGEILHAPLTLGGTLAELPFDKTLREAEFYFPMQGNRVSRLADVISRLRADDYQLPDNNKLKGMMHGFIDLIFEHDGKYFVADYKSTFLGDTLESYSKEAMLNSIYDSSYDVQYCIYAVALHRYLKNTLTGYQPKEHFGGIYYFYLRGMNKNTDAGVFFTTLDEAILNELDQVFSEPDTQETL